MVRRCLYDRWEKTRIRGKEATGRERYSLLYRCRGHARLPEKCDKAIGQGFEACFAAMGHLAMTVSSLGGGK